MQTIIYSYPSQTIDTTALFKEVTKVHGINYKHNDNDYIDFNIQKLLPHKLSQYSPALGCRQMLMAMVG